MADKSYQEIASVLPLHMRGAVSALPESVQGRVEELRLRLGQGITAVCSDGELDLGGPAVQRRDLEQLVELASRTSLHTVLPQICRGYLTVAGGHRIGLTGTAVMSGGEITGLRAFSGADLRIARQVRGAADPVLDRLCKGGNPVNTLILAPPGLGKTTLLRDLIRKVSEGEGCRSMRVSLADERGEVAACFEGRPQLDVGKRTDVLEGCPKAEGLILLLRAMNPQVLAADEITAPEDVRAFELAAGCGTVLFATAHGSCREDLRRRPLYRQMLESGIFRRLVLVHRVGGVRTYTVEELD